MNAELYQIAAIVAAGKKAVLTSEKIAYRQQPFEQSIRFDFLPKKVLFGTKTYTAPDVSAWFEESRKKGLQDLILLCPASADDRNLLGFANASQNAILCLYKNGKASYFTPVWKFDEKTNQWDTLYTEKEWTEAIPEKPRFSDNSAAFGTVLFSVQDLAVKLECENFAKVFATALGLLEGKSDQPDGPRPLALPELPEKNRLLFEAAGTADVFGGMGSWNDAPACWAEQKGLENEYKEISDELLKNVRGAILYAINEW